MVIHLSRRIQESVVLLGRVDVQKRILAVQGNNPDLLSMVFQDLSSSFVSRYGHQYRKEGAIKEHRRTPPFPVAGKGNSSGTFFMGPDQLIEYLSAQEGLIHREKEGGAGGGMNGVQPGSHRTALTRGVVFIAYD